MREWTGRRAPTAALALLVAVAAAACGEQSRVDPDATITISGQLVAPDGSALGGRPVRLGTGITDSDGALAVLTIGLSCTTGACTGNVQDTTSDPAGRYTFTLEGRDTQSSFGEAESVLVSASGSTGPGEVTGPLTSARFTVQAAQLELPALALVDPGLQLESTGGLVARWSPPRVGPYDLSFEDGAEVPVWRVHTAESAVAVDPRVLEDTAGRAVVGGGYEEAIEGSGVEMRWRSPGVPYAAGAGAPPSRGRACRYVDAAGASVDVTDCDLTDGDLVTAAAPPACPAGDGAGCAPATAAVIDLGGAVPAELVVVRGCSGGCAVDVSVDGETFRPAGSVAEELGTVPLAAEPITAVRVGVGSSFPGLREISVWGPAPAQPLVPVDEDQRDALAAPYQDRDGEDDSPPALLVALAALAAVGVLVGLGVVVGRKRAARPTPGS